MLEGCLYKSFNRKFLEGKKVNPTPIVYLKTLTTMLGAFDAGFTLRGLNTDVKDRAQIAQNREFLMPSEFLRVTE